MMTRKGNYVCSPRCFGSEVFLSLGESLIRTKIKKEEKTDGKSGTEAAYHSGDLREC